MAILLPGGAGYIGSHTAVELLNAEKDITGKKFKFYKIDYLDKKALRKVFKKNKIDAVINFAGFKAVGESIEKPLNYYENNVMGFILFFRFF